MLLPLPRSLQHRYFPHGDASHALSPEQTTRDSDTVRLAFEILQPVVRREEPMPQQLHVIVAAGETEML